VLLTNNYLPFCQQTEETPFTNAYHFLLHGKQLLATGLLIKQLIIKVFPKISPCFVITSELHL